MRTSVVYGSREPNRAAVILEALQAAGMTVTVAQKAKEVQGLLAHRGCDLLLIGQKLVDEDGVDLVKQLRAKGPARQMPIVALVEHADAPTVSSAPSKHAYALFGRSGPSAAPSSASAKDKVSLRLAFFQAGADECLSLNWDAAECLARIKAVLRRTQVNAYSRCEGCSS